MPEANEALDARTTFADIDLGAIRHNARVLSRRAGGADLMAVVKADAYGHGAVPVAQALHAEGVRHFAVALVPEAVALREAGIADPILVFAAPLPGFLPAYVAHNLDVTVSSAAVAEAVCDVARRVGPLRVHLKIDTGMGRLGVSPEEAVAVARRLADAPGVTLTGIWTHLATADVPADPFAAQQVMRFTRLLPALGNLADLADLHIANTGALLTRQPDVYPFRPRLARAGLGLYGLFDDPLATADALRPAMRLVSRVTHLKTVAPGTPISYGGTWRAACETRIATVGAGYADGYRRALSNTGEATIGGRRYPVAGRVCMDMFMLDVGSPGGPPGGPPVAVGDEVVLFGAGGPSCAEVAHWADTLTYEVVCGIGARVPRRYHTDE